MWVVTWRLQHAKSKAFREFQTEKKARAFYMKKIRNQFMEFLAIEERQAWDILRKNSRGRWVVEHTLDSQKAAQKLYFKLVLGKDKYKWQAR